MVRQLLDADLIDLFHISIIPVILGNGIRLFPSEGMMWKLMKAELSSLVMREIKIPERTQGLKSDTICESVVCCSLCKSDGGCDDNVLNRTAT